MRKRKQRREVPRSCGQLEIQAPPLRIVQRDLREARFECVFEQMVGVNLYGLHIRLSDGAQVLTVTSGYVGITPVGFATRGTEVFTVEAITPSYLAASLTGAADKFEIAGAHPSEG